MPDNNQIEIIKKGVEVWNNWRANNVNAVIDFIDADLRGINLAGADLHEACLLNANLHKANLFKANLSGATLMFVNLTNADIRSANLSKATLSEAYLYKADLSDSNLSDALLPGANLSEAVLVKTNFSKAYLPRVDFSEANLYKSNLSEADLSYTNFSRSDLQYADLTAANLQYAILVETNVDKSIITNCFVYGISTWGLKGKPKEQANLTITPKDEAAITVDDLQVAQFIYLLINRENLRNVLETITSKAVLVLGRFTPERKIILDAIAEELRKHNLLPVIFDFERATSRDFTETIKILAGMSLFVIADITNPQSAPLELQATVPDYQIPFVSIIQTGENRFSMFDNLIGKYDWVLEPLNYSSHAILRQVFKDLVLERAIAKHKELQVRKAKEIQTLSADDFLKQKLNT